MTLAEIYAAQGHRDRAIETLDRVLAREPDHAAARALVAQLRDESYPVPRRGCPRKRRKRRPRPRSAPTLTSESTAPAGSAEPSHMLDDAPLPTRYDVDECVAIPVDPSTLYVYWEVRERTLEYVRAARPGGTSRCASSSSSRRGTGRGRAFATTTCTRPSGTTSPPTSPPGASCGSRSATGTGTPSSPSRIRPRSTRRPARRRRWSRTSSCAGRRREPSLRLARRRGRRVDRARAPAGAAPGGRRPRRLVAGRDPAGAARLERAWGGGTRARDPDRHPEVARSWRSRTAAADVDVALAR